MRSALCVYVREKEKGWLTQTLFQLYSPKSIAYPYNTKKQKINCRNVDKGRSDSPQFPNDKHLLQKCDILLCT